MLRDLRVLIAMQLTEAADATSAEQVCDIMPPVPGLSSGDGLYAGIDGDGRLEGALHAEGWSYRWAYTTHYWCMEAPDGSALTFIEGDLYIGDQKAPETDAPTSRDTTPHETTGPADSPASPAAQIAAADFPGPPASILPAAAPTEPAPEAAAEPPAAERSPHRGAS